MLRVSSVHILATMENSEEIKWFLLLCILKQTRDKENMKGVWEEIYQVLANIFTGEKLTKVFIWDLQDLTLKLILE